jgi:hypothetical protein
MAVRNHFNQCGASSSRSVRISSLPPDILFTHQTLQVVRRRRGLFSGMQLVHSVGDYPRLIVFRTPDYRSLAAAVRTNGYQLED